MKKITLKNECKIAFLSFLILLVCTSSIYSQVLEVKGNGIIIPDNTSTTTNYIDFGTVPSGNKFSKSFVLKNIGSSNLVFSGAKVAISNTTDFSITTNVIVSTNTLTANTYLIIEISYNPTATSGFQTSRVTITSNSTPAASATYTFNIQGTTTTAVASDFIRTTLSPTFSYPYALIYGPDDYLWLTERGGKKINRVNKTSGAVDLLLDMTALVYYGAITSQDGLLGMALHPNLNKGTGEDYVYVAYSYGTSSADEKLRIVRYTYTNTTGTDGSLASPLVLMEGLSASNDHNSGKLAIGPDYKLYYTIGDQGVNQFINKCEVSHAQDIPTLAMLNSIPPNYNYYEGKTLRMNLDGSIPDDNPVINGIRSHIYTYGHRNAQGLVFGKNGKLYSSEHGPKSDDEINILESGSNYGWPYISGYKDDKNYSFCNWSTASNCASLTFSDYSCGAGATSLTESSWAGTFNPPISTLFTIDAGFNFTGGWLTWPTIGPSSAKIYEGFNAQIPGWDNSILITTLKKGRIYRQKLSADGNTVVGAPEELFYTQNRYRDLAFDPDGKTIYIITDSGGTTSGPSGSSTLSVTDLGKILKFTYTPTILTCSAPVPVTTTLPTITDNCSVISITPPTATNNCAGTAGIVGLTDTVFPITTEGNTTVIWKYNYGDGLTVTQNQTVTINSTTWNGTVWSNGDPSSQSAIIAADYTVTSDLSACSLTVNNNAIVTVNGGVNVTLNGALTVNSGSFTLNNNANLIQSTNANNTGNIIVKRISSALMRLDYSLWSSPVANQNLLSFSPLTTTFRFYNYNTNTNLYNFVPNPSITNFTDGQGYLIRMPNTHPTTAATWNGSFTGVPHNGYFPIVMANGGATNRFNLVGNPYPSPINMSQFVFDNNTKITGTLYFWRKTNGTGSAYCTWAGGTFVTNSNAQTANPNGVIQTGQGFFVEALNASTTIQFNNGQRVSNIIGQFFKTKQIVSERSTLWLNAFNTTGDFSQMAVAYIPGATLGLDEFDGKYYNDGSIALNSIINDEDYVIQSRSLPFDDSETVALSFKTLSAGDYTIALDHYDGLFSGNQEIFLKDKVTSTETNLKTGSYSFTADAGTNNGRFELLYKISSPLGTETLELSENKIIIFKQNKELHIHSRDNKMKSARLYSIDGKLIFEQKNINNTSIIIKDFGLPRQVLFVQITTIENKVINKKIVY